MITAHVITELRNRGLNVVAAACDGKSHPRIARDKDGTPMTYREALKQHWHEVKKIKSIEDVKLACTASETENSVMRLSYLCLKTITRIRSVLIF